MRTYLYVWLLQNHVNSLKLLAYVSNGGYLLVESTSSNEKCQAAGGYMMYVFLSTPMDKSLCSYRVCIPYFMKLKWELINAN